MDPASSRQTAPFLPPTVPLFAVSCRFCHPEHQTSRCRSSQIPLNSACERMLLPTHRQKTAKTAMVNPSQLYRPVIALPRRVKRAGWGVRAPRHPLAHDAAGFFSPCDISAHFALIRIRQYRDHVAGWAIRQRDGHAPTAVIEYAPNGQAHSMARKGVRTRARVVASVRGGERGRAASAHVFREYPVHTSYTVHRHPVRVWRVGG